MCHWAATLLDCFSSAGIPMLLISQSWSLEQKDAAMNWGNHLSVHSFTEVLYKEFTDMQSKGMFLILPYSLVRHLPQLGLYPIGCIPQCDQWPHIIIDHMYSRINHTTNKLALVEATQWFLWYFHTANCHHGMVYLSKTNLSDGFYQFQVTLSRALMLATLFPSDPDCVFMEYLKPSSVYM